MSQMDRSERNSSHYLLEQNAAFIGICFIFQCFIFIQDRQAVALTDLKFSGQMPQPVFQTFSVLLK